MPLLPNRPARRGHRPDKRHFESLAANSSPSLVIDRSPSRSSVHGINPEQLRTPRQDVRTEEFHEISSTKGTRRGEVSGIRASICWYLCCCGHSRKKIEQSRRKGRVYTTPLLKQIDEPRTRITLIAQSTPRIPKAYVVRSQPRRCLS